MGFIENCHIFMQMSVILIRVLKQYSNKIHLKEKTIKI